MAVYQYKALDLDATTRTGTIIADTPRQARDLLRDRALAVLHLTAMAASDRPSWRARRKGRRARTHVATFVRELATLQKAGIPLVEGLDTCVQQHKGEMKSAIQQLRDQVASGKSLAEAMAGLPVYFDEFCVSIVRVGESTGTLESALNQLAEFREKAHALRSRVTTALAYPTVVVILGLAVTVFLMTYVVPNLLGTLKQAGKPLPAITQAVSAISDVLVHGWWAILAGVVALAVGIQAALRTERGRMVAHRLVLRIPAVGDLIRKENTSRMATVMSALLRSGLEFVQAIQITRNTLTNRVFRRAMDQYEQAVTAGRDIAAPLAAAGVFSPLVVRILAVGQQAGELEEMLDRLAESYDQQVAIATGRLTAMLEPLLIVVLAVMVGFIAFATILPILEASNVF